jgi:hypothetical protein
VSTSTKHAVEIEYGMDAKSHGKTLEIDHIVSLELGGSMTSPTSFRRSAISVPATR